jgi:hypothetical protein
LLQLSGKAGSITKRFSGKNELFPPLLMTDHSFLDHCPQRFLTKGFHEKFVKRIAMTVFQHFLIFHPEKDPPRMDKQTHWLGYVAGILSLIFAAMFLHG